MRRLWQFLAFSNLLIAILAVSYSVAYLVLWEGRMIFSSSYLALLFFGTLGLYSLHAIVSYKWVDINSQSLRIEWIRQHIKLLLALATISIIACLYLLLWHSEWTLILNVLIALPAGIIYVLPYNSNGKRVRDLPFVKIFLVAFFWTYYCVFVPIFELNDLSDSRVLLILTASLLFIFSLTIPFDFRDRDIDSNRYVRTFGNAYSITTTRWIIYSLQCIVVILFSILCLNGFLFSLSFILTSGYVLLLINKLTEAQEDLYFSVFVEIALALPLLFNLILLNIIN